MYGFDREEVFQIAVSMLVVALAFSIGRPLSFLPITILGVGTGFVLHELAHKFVAIRYGAFARYQAWESGLILALFLAFVTNGAFVFAAPGAVYIYAPYLSKRQNGIISVAGPLTNLVVGLALLAFVFVVPSNYLALVAFEAASINFFLGIFNMLPIPPLDGSKVFAWNVPIWALLAIPLAVLAFFPDTLLGAVLQALGIPY